MRRSCVTIYAPKWELTHRVDGTYVFSCHWSTTGDSDPDLQEAAIQRLMQHVKSVGVIKVTRESEAKDGTTAPQ